MYEQQPRPHVTRGRVQGSVGDLNTMGNSELILCLSFFLFYALQQGVVTI